MNCNTYESFSRSTYNDLVGDIYGSRVKDHCFKVQTFM